MAKVTTTLQAARKIQASIPEAIIYTAGRKAIISLVLANDTNGVAAKAALQKAAAALKAAGVKI